MNSQTDSQGRDRTHLELEKLRREVEKLGLEVRDKRRPGWKRAGSWVPWITTVALVVGIVFQWRASAFESRLASQRAEVAGASARAATAQSEAAAAQANSLLEDTLQDLRMVRQQVRAQLNETKAGIEAEDSVKELDATLALVERTLSGRGAWSRHLAVGKPQACVERLREGYAVGLDARLRIPAWVQYELTAEDLGGETPRGHFSVDETIPAVARAQLEDYRRSGFDKGHLAPVSDSKRSGFVMGDSYLLTNVAPQEPGLNRHAWVRLEQAVRIWTSQRSQLVVITGPVFPTSNETPTVKYAVIGENRVAVPAAFFKIVVDVRVPSLPEALAFMFPNDESLNPRIPFDDDRFRVSIDELERLTGLDFLSALPESAQARVESQIQPIWPFPSDAM